MAPSQRRRSIDSSSSSSESSPNPHNPSQSEKQRATTGASGGSGDAKAQTSSARGDHEPPPSYTASASASAAVPVAPPPQVPPSGYRIPLTSPDGSPFPGVERTREAPFTDADGKSPVFIGSAIMQYSVHPCKIAPNHPRPCFVSYGGEEIHHEGRYDLLPFVPEHMEFVQTSGGRIPPGRRPVKGGFEHDGKELYHAVAVVEGIKVPGKTGLHFVRPHLSFWTAMQNDVDDSYHSSERLQNTIRRK